MIGNYVVNVVCFNCNKSSKATMSLLDYYDRVKDGSLFNHKCPTCGMLYTLKFEDGQLKVKIGDRNVNQAEG